MSHSLDFRSHPTQESLIAAAFVKMANDTLSDVRMSGDLNETDICNLVQAHKDVFDAWLITIGASDEFRDQVWVEINWEEVEPT